MYLLENSLSKGLIKITHRFRPETVIVKRRGARWALSKGNFIEERLLQFRYYEAEQLAFTEDFLCASPVDCFYDIGANIGLYSIHLGVRGLVPKAHAFEPVQRNFERLRQNIGLNRLEVRITPHKIALSDKPGTALIHVDRQSAGHSQLESFADGRTRSYSEEVALAVFDDLFAVKRTKAFVKMDTEGHEARVLAGMSRFLSSNDITLQIELYDSEAEKLLGGLGYKRFHNIGADTWFRRA